LRWIEARIDRSAREVSAHFFGWMRKTAKFRPGQGCAVDHGHASDARETPGASTPAQNELRTDAAQHAASGRVREVLDWAFSEPDPARLRRTRAVLIVHKGEIVAERYAEGFTKDTPLPGWSMTKSVMNALVGILVKEKRIALQDPVPIREWRGAGDPRGRITVGQLLHMTSGLEFKEDYTNPLADVTYMLLAVPDTAAYALTKPLEAGPGVRWRYSSGTTNILAYAMRHLMGETEYLEFPRRALFDRIGMATAVLETDAAGTFVGSSFMYATARDWARFGVLYLREGVWAGERILPQGWVAYSRTPVPSAPEAQYGAHFWLRVPQAYRCGSSERSLPGDAFHAIGHEGQFLTIIPSHDLVLVRLGFTRYPCAWDHIAFVQRSLDAVVQR
jgi:CubicO group peptidase (beta-lactamase class C family)